MNNRFPKIPLDRYLVAILVAFVASVATGGVYVLIAVSTGMTSDSFPVLSVILVGFNGVLLGSLCFRRSDRLFGAVVLLAVGICFDVLVLGWGHGEFHFHRGTIATAFGGVVAAGIWFWRRPRNGAGGRTEVTPRTPPKL